MDQGLSAPVKQQGEGGVKVEGCAAGDGKGGFQHLSVLAGQRGQQLLFCCDEASAAQVVQVLQDEEYRLVCEGESGDAVFLRRICADADYQ